MAEQSARPLSYHEAAELIYQTKQPTEAQIDKVAYKLSRGALKGSSRGRWVTAESVAAYIAAKVEHQRLAGRPRQPDRRAASLAEGRRVLPPIYRRGLQDYVAAVLRRRRFDDAPAGFRRAVLAGQVGLILLPAAVLFLIYLTAVAPTPEQTAVQRWLEREVGEFQIVQWFPPEQAPDATRSRQRVRYKYFTATRKQILTDRTFVLEGRTVVSWSQTGD